MKIIKIDRKNNYLELVPETLDDFWHLERIIEEGDLVKGQTLRTLESKDVPGKKEKIKMFLELKTEKVSLDKYGPKLRVTGIIISGKPEEFLELGSHHTLDLELMQRARISKPKGIKEYQLKRLKKAELEGKKSKLLLIAMDEDRADFALLKEFGLEPLFNIFSGKAGKQYASESVEKKYFSEIIEKINNIDCDKVVVAGPGFARQNFKKYVDENQLKKQFFFESISATGLAGLNEIIKRGIVERIESKALVVEETKLVEGLLKEVFRESKKISYGFKETSNAVQAKAVSELFVTDAMLLEKRKELEEIMDLVEKNGGKVHLISIAHEAGKKLEGLGGIAALLWFEVK